MTVCWHWWQQAIDVSSRWVGQEIEREVVQEPLRHNTVIGYSQTVARHCGKQHTQASLTRKTQHALALGRTNHRKNYYFKISTVYVTCARTERISSQKIHHFLFVLPQNRRLSKLEILILKKVLVKETVSLENRVMLEPFHWCSVFPSNVGLCLYTVQL